MQEIVYLSVPKLNGFANPEHLHRFNLGRVQEIGLSIPGANAKIGPPSESAPSLANHLAKVESIVKDWRKQKCVPHSFDRLHCGIGDWVSFKASMSHTTITEVDDQFAVFLGATPIIRPDHPYRTRLLLHGSARNLITSIHPDESGTSSAEYSRSRIFYAGAMKSLDAQRQAEQARLAALAYRIALGQRHTGNASGIIRDGLIRRFVGFLDEQPNLMIEEPELMSGYARVTRTATHLPDRSRIVLATPLIIRRGGQRR